MKILFFDWTTFGDRDIVEAFTVLGHQVVISDLYFQNELKDEVFLQQCQTLLQDNDIQLVFTSNYFPIVAEACHLQGVIYMSWVYDSPQMLLYHNSIHYPTNYVFVFDSKEYQRMQNMKILNVYYMPLATNAERLDALSATEEQIKKYSCDVAFVGTLYDQEHMLYDRMHPRLTEYDRGYLEGLLQAQRNVYGYYFLEERLEQSDVLERMYQAMPYAVDQDIQVSNAYIYGNYFMGRKLAELERKEVLSTLGAVCDTHVYTDGHVDAIPSVHNLGCINYFEEMPLAFRYAKINLNISLRTIQNGIPLRCFDIMGAGGFLLTNYQMDFTPLFEAGEDYVCYNSREDLYDKVCYYLEHEEERKQIAKNGHDKVLKYHSYVHRLKEMLEIVTKE